MPLAPDIRDFADEFASQIEAADYANAHGMLAPWLREEATPAALQIEIETQLKDVAGGFDINELIYPDGHELDSGALSYADLRDGGLMNKTVPAEVTADNFEVWMCIQFLCQNEDIDIDAWMDFWMAVVRHNGEILVGYYEIMDPD